MDISWHSMEHNSQLAFVPLFLYYRRYLYTTFIVFFPGGSNSKESACNARDLGLVPESRRASGERNGYPLQYSCLENSVDRGAWQATIYCIYFYLCLIFPRKVESLWIALCIVDHPFRAMDSCWIIQCLSLFTKLIWRVKQYARGAYIFPTLNDYKNVKYYVYHFQVRFKTFPLENIVFSMVFFFPPQWPHG